MNPDIQEAFGNLPELGLLLVILLLAVAALVKKFVKSAKVISEAKPEDLINYFLTNVKDQVIPQIVRLALHEELSAATSYDEFKRLAADKLGADLYKILADAINDGTLTIPENLKIFFNEDLVQSLVLKSFDIDEVSEALSKAYDKSVNKYLVSAAKVEAENQKFTQEIAPDGDEDATVHKVETSEDSDTNDGSEDDASDDTDDGDVIEPIEEDDHETDTVVADNKTDVESSNDNSTEESHSETSDTPVVEENNFDMDSEMEKSLNDLIKESNLN